MATSRSTAMPLGLAGATSIAAAIRHHARNAARPVELVVTCRNTTSPTPWPQDEQLLPASPAG